MYSSAIFDTVFASDKQNDCAGDWGTVIHFRSRDFSFGVLFARFVS